EGWAWVEVSTDEDYRFIGQCSRIHAALKDPPAELLAEKKRWEAELDTLAEAHHSGEDDGDGEDLDAREEAARERLVAIEEELDGYLAFDPEEMNRAGCYVSVGHGGKLSIERGLVRDEDRKERAKAKSGEHAEGRTESEKPKEQLSEAFRR